MAKNNYESKIASAVSGFKIPAKEEKKATEPVATPPREEDEQPTDKDIWQNSYARQSYYLSYEHIAAIDYICDETHIGKSDIVRQIMQAGLEAVCPGVFEKSADRADELRKKCGKKKNKSMELFNTLQSKLGGGQ